MTLTLRGANAGVITADGTAYGTSSACLRAMFFRQFAGDCPVSPESDLTFAAGFAHEKVQVKWLEDNGFEVEADKEVVEPLSDQVVFTGHVDIFRKEPRTVYELKGITSENVFHKIFFKRAPKPENVVQIVGYMLATETEIGYLRYASFLFLKLFDTTPEMQKIAKSWPRPTMKFKKDWDTQRWVITTRPDYCEFKIQIMENGDILIDDKRFEFTVQDLVRYRTAAVDVLENKSIPPAPKDIHKSKFAPCTQCAFKTPCKRWDDGDIKSADSLIEAGKEAISLLTAQINTQRKGW